METRQTLMRTGIIKTILLFSMICFYGFVVFVLLSGRVGFGMRIGDVMYAQEGFGSFKIPGIVLLIVLPAVGFYLLRRRFRSHGLNTRGSSAPLP
jgi:hypothetical protein